MYLILVDIDSSFDVVTEEFKDLKSIENFNGYQTSKIDSKRKFYTIKNAFITLNMCILLI